MKIAQPSLLLWRSFAPQLVRFTCLLAALLLTTLRASAYLVGPPVSLEKLTEEADVIFKGTMVGEGPVHDAWFQPVADFDAVETQFTVISTIKGEVPAGKLRFRHYDESAKQTGRMYSPQFYHFDGGHTYVVFAKKTATENVLRQLWPNHKGKEDQGLLRCADKRPAVPGTVREEIWAELQTLLRSPVPADVLYSLRQIDQMSGAPGDFGATKDFDRGEAMQAIGYLMESEDLQIARTVLQVIGSRNPYLADDSAQYWLATVGSAEIPGIGQMDPNVKNLGGELFWKQLIALGNGPGPVATRALAIRALGRVKNAALTEPLARWLGDPEPPVRAAAALLLADFPEADAAKRLGALSADAAPEVRCCAAHAIGFLQLAKLSAALGALLKDPDTRVRFAASQSLLSFSPKDAGIAKVLAENVANKEFSPLFLNALAKEQPEKYLDALAASVSGQATPTNWQGGQVPSFTSFNILFKYLQQQPVAAVQTGKFDRYLDAMEKGYVTGSSEPRDIYAFYLQRDMKERAKKYRTAAVKEAHYDLDYFFNEVDRDPARFTR